MTEEELKKEIVQKLKKLGFKETSIGNFDKEIAEDGDFVEVVPYRIPDCWDVSVGETWVLIPDEEFILDFSKDIVLQLINLVERRICVEFEEQRNELHRVKASYKKFADKERINEWR